MVRKVLGVVLLAWGILLLAWITYNMVVERLPEAEGRSLWKGLIFSCVLIFAGVRWIRTPHPAKTDLPNS